MNRTLPLAVAATLLVAATFLVTAPPAAATRYVADPSPKEGMGQVCGLNCARCGCQEVPRDKQQQAHLKAIDGDASALCLDCRWPVKPAATGTPLAESLGDEQRPGPHAVASASPVAATSTAAATRALLNALPGPGEMEFCGPNCTRCGCRGFPDEQLEQLQKRARGGDAYAFCRDCCWLEKVNVTGKASTGSAGGNKR